MTSSKSYLTKLAVRGSLLVLGLLLFFFYIYPPLLLFFKGQNVLLQQEFYRKDFISPLINSLRISIGVFLASTAIGAGLAWVVVKTDFRHKKLLDNLSLVAFAVPPYLLALSWMQLFGRNGYTERFISFLFPESGWHSQPYSLAAVTIIMSLHLYPLMYMSIRNAMEQIDPGIEKAALLAGASSLRVTFEVTLPLVLPNILSTGLLVFSRTMANFAVPALLCLPMGIEVISTGIYSSLSSLKVDHAAALSLLLVAISTGLYITQAYALHRRQSQKTSGNKGSRRAFLLGRGKPVCLTIVIIFFAVTLVLPFGAMFISSFLKRWGLPLEPRYFTFNNYAEIFNPRGKTALAFKNSITYGLTASVLASLIGGGAAIAGAYIKSKAGIILEAAASWPMAIPNTVLAVAAIFAWNRPPLRLYGSCWAIIVTYGVLFTPIILKQISGLLHMRDHNLLNAARMAGASSLRAFAGITLPMLLPGFRSGIVLCMMIALREIPISLLLYSSGQETVGVLLFGMQSQSYGLEMTSALAIVVLILIITGNILTTGNRRRIK